jgi:hypothetical protein
MFTDFVPELKFHLRLCKLLNCLPFHYNEKSGRLYKTNSATEIKTSTRLTTLHFLYLAAMTIHIVVSEMQFTNRLQGMLFLSMIGILFVGRPYGNVDSSPIQLVNAFLNFESQLGKGEAFAQRKNHLIN